MKHAHNVYFSTLTQERIARLLKPGESLSGLIARALEALENLEAGAKS